MVLGKRAKRLMIASLAVALAVLAPLGVYYVRAQSIKANGIELKPAESHPVAASMYYLQGDPLWAQDYIGRSETKMQSAGCLISSCASAISALGIPVTPKELNEKLTAVNGYDGDRLTWNKLSACFSQIDYRYSRVFSAKTLEDDLKNGLLPIVNVRYMGSGITHWVLVLGAQGGDFMIADPLFAQRTPLPLSTHGRVYAYRVIERKERSE